MKKPSQIIEELKRKNRILRRKEREAFTEMTERGKELERISRIVGGCCDQMSPEVIDMLMEPLSSYIERCTKISAKEKKRRNKDAGQNKTKL